jgi:hypothetical protein
MKTDKHTKKPTEVNVPDGQIGTAKLSITRVFAQDSRNSVRV